MRILLVMDPGIEVPPLSYGGHERLVAMFAKAYFRMGHEVTLLVGPGSYFPEGKVIEFGNKGYPKTKTEGVKDIVRAWRILASVGNEFDCIHNFGRLAYLLPVLNRPVRKIMTYGREISTRNIRYINRLPRKNLVFTGCSRDLISRAGVKGNWHTVYNAIEFENYQLKEKVSADAPFMFLGRIERVKGLHHALEVIKKAGENLIIAGNISSLPEERAYFESEIQPHIDGQQIRYVGALNDTQKNKYLGEARALLFPIEWNEPFGMVMIEAMACGTPVIAFRRGSVPEVVEEGKTGMVVDSKKQMLEALSRVAAIDRKECRTKAEKRFDAAVIASGYLQLVS